MVRRHRRRPADPRRRRLLATITAACAALSLACIPAATARSGHDRTTGHEKTAPAPATPAAPAGEAEGALEAAPTARPTKSTSKPSKHGKRPGGTPTPTAGAPAPTAGTVVPASGTPEKPGKAKHAETGSTTEQRRSQEGAAGKVTSTRVTRAKAKKVEAARSSAPQGSGSGAAASAPTPATPATAPPATLAAAQPATTVAPPVATPQSQPRVAASPRSARPTGARGHAHKPVRASARATSIAPLPAAGLLAAASPARGVPASRPARAPRHKGHRTASPSIVAPLATTITKIVDVVPTPIRALIGALLALALAFAVRSRFAARRARRLEHQRGQLLEDVGLLQAALLPVPPARLGPVGTTAAYRPAAGPAAGGDFYDVFALEDGQLAVIVGDVSGHGRTALPHTALVRFTLRAYLEAGLSPRRAVQTAGSVLHRQLGSFFVTVVAATYNPRTRVLVYASAGHPPPIVLGGDDAALTPVTASSAPPIGVGLPTGTRQSIVSVPGRAQICFHTDGVTEARVANELFGRGRLTDALVELGPEGTASGLLDRVAEAVDRRPDDMAACLLGVDGDTRTPLTLREELELDRETVASERTEQFLLSCGLRAAELPAVMHVAAAAVARAGSVVLEVHQEQGRARASLQHDNIAYLQTRHDPRQAELTVSR